MIDGAGLWPALPPPSHYTLAIPNAGRWLTANDRGAWRRHAPQVAAWRRSAGWAARAARLPMLPRAYVLAELRFTDNRRRDPGNWYPTVKAAVDGLVDVGVLADDSAAHLVGPDLRVGPAVGGTGQLVLHIWRLT